MDNLDYILVMTWFIITVHLYDVSFQPYGMWKDRQCTDHQSSHKNDIISTFQHHKSQKIMSYSSIIYGLLTRLWQQKTTDIKLPVTITDAKTMTISFSTYANYITNNYFFINGLLFQEHILKFHDFCST